MLLQFSVNNYKSIKDTVTFSMQASLKDEGNIFETKKYKLLNSAVLYGSNASGKSNVLKAMAFMHAMVLNKHKIIQSTDRLPHSPFKLSSETEAASSSFEIVFFQSDLKYRYGFESDQKTVFSEWLFLDEKGKESKLFYRDLEDESYVNPNKFIEGIRFFDKKNKKINIADNQLLIWKCDQEDGEISKNILAWFKNFNLVDGMKHENYINFTMKKMECSAFRGKMVDLIKTADIGIEDVFVDEERVPKDIIENMPIPDEIKKMMLAEGDLKSVSLNTLHKKFDKDNNNISMETFSLEGEESKGTNKFFKMSAPILDTLDKGGVLVIDELDASLHTLLTQHLISLFQNEKINKNKAQLIFATHDTNLLSKHLFRRDQIWLTEKDCYGVSNIFSLAQFSNVRKNEDFEKQYMQGKYGAIPYLSQFEMNKE